VADPIRGFPFPFKVDAAGGIPLVTGPEKLRQNIVHLLLTDIGERVMRRGYGGGMRALLHDPNNDALRAIVQHQVGKALVAWEPRVQLRQITIDPSADPGTLEANVAFVASPNPVPTSVRVPIGVGV
jgi:phage baseplate assembly protein W